MGLNHLISARTDFSIGESLLQAKTLAARAHELGFESVAVADTMSISGMVDFSNAMKDEGIKPIIGVTLRVFDDPLYRKPKKATGEKPKSNPFFMPKVYAKNENGLKSILKVLSKGNSEDYYYYHSRVGMDELLAMEDVIVTTGDLFSLFNHPYANRIFESLLSKFNNDLLVEIVPIHTPLYDRLNTDALALAQAYDVKLISSYPSLYTKLEEADSLDVYRAITTQAKMDSRTLPIPYTRDFVVEDTKSLLKRLIATTERLGLSSGVVRNIINNQGYIADHCEYEFKKLEPCLPVMAEDEFRALAISVKEGWNRRFSKEVLGHKPSETELSVYRERLVYELGVLKSMGFSNYFLLTQDIVNWSKDNGIIVGPGRGSVGGSLVAYLMGITDVDPIRFNLLFERFINPERIDLPDADLDFQSTRRHEVLAYIIEKYGRDRVAGVSNYTSLASASALRDAGRVFDLDLFEMNCTKLVPKEHGQPVTLTEAAAAVPEIEKFMLARPKIWQHALHLEGAMRGMGQHAAGIVVAGEPLIERAVVETRSGGAVVNWDKRVVEDWGLIKMDILGLSTLDVLGLAAKYIKERHGRTINYTSLPLEEPDVMKAFAKGETVGIFQFESSGMRRLLKDLASVNPLTFEDLSAATALYRPGPMDSGLMEDFVAIKKGTREAFYEHPAMEDALKATYGVIVYQEQVMQVARDLAGFTLAEADHLRKAMGKKDKDKMSKMREQWVKGCVVSGMTAEDAEYLFDKIEAFAGYGFNRSHAVEYSIISYWAMYLKVRYPAEFYAASMTVADDDEKLTALVLDAKSKKIEVMPPDINVSSGRIEINGDFKLHAPFQAVKGISETISGYILAYRTAVGGRFEDLAQFTPKAIKEALGHAKLNKKHVDTLTRVGAMAEIDPGSLPARHPDRVKDQVELMPGFSVEAVKADRVIDGDKLNVIQIVRMMEETRSCDKCTLAGGVHVLPRMGKTPKFMVVFDAPNHKEEKEGKMVDKDAMDVLKALLAELDMSINDGYYTSLVKSPKNDKMLSNEQINGCSGYLMQEIAILKPPVIVTLGSASQRFFAPGLKGGADLAGKVLYRPDLDASIVFGINPAQLYFTPSKVELLRACFKQVKEIVE